MRCGATSKKYCRRLMVSEECFTRQLHMKKTSKHNLATDAVEMIHRRYYDGRPQPMAGLAEAEANDTVAREICELRKRAGLTQQQLAKLAGTTTSVICR